MILDSPSHASLANFPAVAGPFGFMKQIVDRTLAPMVPVFVAMAAGTWHWALPVRPEVILRGVAFMTMLDPMQAPDGEPELDDRQLRWFLGLRVSERDFAPELMGEGQRLLVSNVLARQFVKDVVTAGRAHASSTGARFYENAGLIDAWTLESQALPATRV